MSQGVASCLASYLRKALEGNWELEMQRDGYPTQVPDPLITGGPATKGGTFIHPPLPPCAEQPMFWVKALQIQCGLSEPN